MDEQTKKSDSSASAVRGRKRGLLFIALAIALFLGAKAVHLYTNLGLLIVVMNIFAFCFVLYGLCELISPDESPLISIETTEDKEKEEKTKKYNSFKYTCPMCGGHRVKNIGTAKKLAGVAAVGLASKNIGKNYQCDDCGYKW